VDYSVKRAAIYNLFGLRYSSFRLKKETY